MADPQLPYQSLALVDLDWLLQQHSRHWERADLHALTDLGRIARQVSCVIGCYRRLVEQLSDGIRPRHTALVRRARARRRPWQLVSRNRFAYRDREAEQRVAAALRIEPLVSAASRAGIRCLCVPGFGAEDVIGTLATRYRRRCTDVRLACDASVRMYRFVDESVRICTIHDPVTMIDRAHISALYPCPAAQIIDWHLLDRALRRACPDQNARRAAVQLILDRNGSMTARAEHGLQRRLRSSVQLELFPELAPEIRAALQSDTFRPWDRAEEFHVDTGAPVDDSTVLQRPNPEVLTDEEQRALDGDFEPTPELPISYQEFRLDAPDTPRPITEAQVVGGGEGFSVSLALAAGGPALIINWSTMDWLLPEDDRVGGGGGVLLLFSSLAERDEHLEQLWRRGEA